MKGVVTLTAVGLLALAGCGGEEEAEQTQPPASQAAKTFELVGTDFKFQPDTIRIAKAGTFRFRLQNDGNTNHALEIEGGDVEQETDEVGPGKTIELTVELKNGEYEFYCPVDGHKELGMKGKIVVGGGAGGGATTGETETDDGY